MIDLRKSKTYHRDECALFLKTKDRFGGLSNMAAGYSLLVNGIRILTSEALYQACRFPHKPDIQKLIIGQASPMTAKMVGKPHQKDSRPDWDEVRVQIMRWCLRVKLAQHWETFGELLLSTGEQPIVEEASRDPFWGAQPTHANTLIGANVLGVLLTELREALKSPHADQLRIVEPPSLHKFLLVEKPIGVIESPKAPSKIKPTLFGDDTIVFDRCISVW
jgi:type I restriction enzyme, S subunit